MCIFQKAKIEIYTEQPQLWPLYFEEGESNKHHRSRMFVERKKRREENKARNQLADPIGLEMDFIRWKEICNKI